MAANFARRLERLEQLVRDQNRASGTPLYFRLAAGNEEAAALDGLVAEARIGEHDRERVEFIARIPITPPKQEEVAAPTADPTGDLLGADTRKPPKGFNGRLPPIELGIV